MSNELTAEIIDQLYEDSVINFVASEKPRKSIHVSDLTSECMRKAWYRLNDYAKDLKDFKKSLPLAHGTALHNIINLGGIEHELTMFCNIHNMTDNYKEKREMKELDIINSVKGSMDDLIEIDDELIIADKKTVKKGLPKVAKPEHVAQMNIYKLLYYITTGVEISRAALVYIEKTSCWERHRTCMVDLQPIEDIRKFVLDKLQILDTDSPPPKVVTFLCPWCDYYTECNPSGR